MSDLLVSFSASKRAVVLRSASLGLFTVVFFLLAGAPSSIQASELIDTIKRIKPSIVAVGTFQRTRRPAANLEGTGFAIHDGLHIVTNAHVVSRQLDQENRESLAIFVGTGKEIETRIAELVHQDQAHDTAILRITGRPLPVLKLADDQTVNEGQEVAFTGFPIGAVLGLFPVTHRGIVSAISPIAIPQQSPDRLSMEMIRQLQNPFPVFQLDATAYPGNSGSPLYDAATGDVYAIVSSVTVKKSRENILKDPSGITYAIPIRYAKALLKAMGSEN